MALTCPRAFPCADEAMTGGFWRVVPLDDERFGLFRVNLADGLARSPASIASFLEAAGSALPTSRRAR